MKSFFSLREELDSCCDSCMDDSMFGSVEEYFDSSGDEQYEDWGEHINEGKGLWANIHAKRERIKRGSDERMRKPGSKGAPTKQAMKMASESSDNDEREYDYEGDMAMSDLRSIIVNAKEIHDMLTETTNLPEWVQSKITKAEDYISTVRNYMKTESMDESVYNGKKVQLNKPFRTSDGKGKFAVYTKNDKGNVVKVNFGDTTGLTIKTSNPDRRRNFRARHNCDNPGPKHKARYWSCKSWSRDTVSSGLGI